MSGRTLLSLSLLLVGSGALLLLSLGWALVNRLDRWEARPFVLLIYGAALCCFVAWLTYWKGRAARIPGQEGSPEGGPQRLQRMVEAGLQNLTGVLTLIFLWVWFPPMERLVGWIIRQASCFKYLP